MISRRVVFLLGIFYTIGTCLSIGFVGQIEDVPSKIEEVHEIKNKKVLNGHNYQSRFNVELVLLNTREETKLPSGGPDRFKGVKGLLDKDYKFQFNDLSKGDYELIVDSYDFYLSHNRFRIIIDNEDGIIAYEDFLGHNSYNESSGVSLNDKTLKIQFRDVKQFYEQSQGSLYSIIDGSPFGFIFRSPLYTTLFTVCMAIVATPYILSWVSPEFAESLNEIKQHGDIAKIPEKVQKLDTQDEKAPLKQSRGNKQSIRRRK
ncbi:uncharacterized protein PRCAT00000669001 [Priceomyces carsonii]|uniref:uncharacterized protein n=1 Tax=Priceomyces carsonii TaxID=28549 RepID=UPI002EDA7C4B|nr:unnamed protein product [Priceomyces carsonii]